MASVLSSMSRVTTCESSPLRRHNLSVICRVNTNTGRGTISTRKFEDWDWGLGTRGRRVARGQELGIDAHRGAREFFVPEGRPDNSPAGYCWAKSIRRKH